MNYTIIIIDNKVYIAYYKDGQLFIKNKKVKEPFTDISEENFMTKSEAESKFQELYENNLKKYIK